jgi:site-specific recombinase
MSTDVLDAELGVPAALGARILAGTASSGPEELARVLRWLRPADPGDSASAATRLGQLAQSLRGDARAREWARQALREAVAISAGTPLFAESGILSTRGFLAEIRGRLYERALPAPPRPGNLRDVFEGMFDQPGDATWAAAVPAAAWIDLFAALDTDAATGQAAADILQPGIVGAIEVLALRIAAEGTETELSHTDPDTARHDSPFLALQREVAAWLAAAEAGGGDATAVDPPLHAHVFLEQCLERVDRLRSIGRRRGTSVRITYLLERMEQQLRRLELLMRAEERPQGSSRSDAAMTLFVALVRASSTRLSVVEVWDANTRLLSKNVTENASRTGEHYATESSAEYYQMMRSAMGAGLVIALMALLKLQIRDLHLPPLVDTILVCADYALGFVLISILHFTVATKQPAMTAAMIAATVEETSQSTRAPLDKLARLVASVTRTQLVAIFGNIALALPTAMAIASAYTYFHGVPFLPPAKVESMLYELRPVMGYALLHGAIAGVWLFAAGLVSGWYDNRCAVLDIPDRVRGSPLLRWLPQGSRERLAGYVDGNLGAFMGNAIFGIMLGATGFVGILLGLNIDIRHVTFASANLGYAAVSADLAPAALGVYLAFVIMVGAMNLAVSFGLALNVAMRARDTTFARAGDLVREILKLLRSNPRAFFLPPKEGA